jgi:hypothetical protein
MINGTIPFGSITTSNAAGFQFMGPTATVTTSSNSQKITGSGSAAIATSTGVATGVLTGLCYRVTGGSTISNFANASYEIVEVGTTRTPVAVSASVTNLAPGTYDVGMCIRNTSAVVIDDNDYINGWFIVTN